MDAEARAKLLSNGWQSYGFGFGAHALWLSPDAQRILSTEDALAEINRDRPDDEARESVAVP